MTRGAFRHPEGSLLRQAEENADAFARLSQDLDGDLQRARARIQRRLNREG